MIRYLIGVLVFTATMVSYILRVSLNIAIVTMTDGQDKGCHHGHDINYNYINHDGQRRFCWSTSMQGWLKSSFFIGYILLQIHGGSLAEKFGTRKVLGTALFLTAMLTLLTPVVAVWNVWALIAIRVLMGIAEGVTFPSLPPLVQRWVPQQETSKFISFSYSGGNFGTVITYPLCGLILAQLDWEPVFYITGGFSIIWCLIWFLLLTDRPHQHFLISKQEVEYIESNLNPDLNVKNDESRPMPPYGQILKSAAVWTVIFCDFANGWGLTTILVDGPNFIDKVLKINIQENGLYNAAPHLTSVVLSLVFGFLSDWLISKGHLSIAKASKLFECIGFAMPGLALATMGFFTQDFRICLSILIIGFGCRGAVYNGHIKSILLLSPNFSGTVYGFSNGLGSISAILTPLVTAAITDNNEESAEKWRYVFFIATGLYILACLNYLINGKFSPQKFDFETKSGAIKD